MHPATNKSMLAALAMSSGRPPLTFLRLHSRGGSHRPPLPRMRHPCCACCWRCGLTPISLSVHIPPPPSLACACTGTKFRTMLRSGEEIPDWFAFKSVVAVLREQIKAEEGK